MAILKDGFFNNLKYRFERYIDRFDATEAVCRAGFELKREHSLYVADEAAAIAQAIGLAPEDVKLARVIGLLHDIGRFVQLAHYGTFRDEASIDHGDLGAGIIGSGQWLSPLGRHDRLIVRTAVIHHNKARLPEFDDERCRLFARLIRDADKLDIFRVLRDRYNGPEWPESGELRSSDDISDDVFRDVLAGRLVDRCVICNPIDWVFFRICWLFDINFEPTLDMILQRGYITMLTTSLPETDKIGRALDVLEAYIDSRRHVSFYRFYPGKSYLLGSRANTST